MGSLVGICGRVLRVPDDSGLDPGRDDDDDDDDVSAPLDLDMPEANTTKNNKISQHLNKPRNPCKNAKK